MAMRNIARLLLLAHVSLAGCDAFAPRVQVYLTTGDRAHLLERQPDVRFGAAEAQMPTIDVDESKSYQQIVGFGAALTDASAWLIQHRMSAAQRDSLLTELFGHVGLSFLRIDMGASDFALRQDSYDDTPPITNFSIDADRAETLPIVKRARAINRDLAIMASPWSAPGWMKTTGSMIKGTLRPDAYGAYAEYFRRFVDAYAAEGVPIYAITLQNEPHFEPGDYPGMRLEPPQRAQLVRLLGPTIKTKILEWDHNWDLPQSPMEVLADSGARRYVSGVAWHCYAGDVSVQSIVHDAYPTKDAYITECSGGDWAPKFSDNLVWMVKNLIIGGTRNWARGVLLWNLALDEQHGPHTGGCTNCRGVVTIKSDGTVQRNEEYYALAHASQFVAPGARRIASSTGVEGLESVAFARVTGESVIVTLIVLNTSLTPKAFMVHSHGRRLRYTLPPAAVATFQWR
jgi:glucosylceramidase